MAKALPRKVRDNLEKCRAAALAAVDVYNRPGPRFRTAHYIVLIVIAWCGFFHAIAYRKRRNPWYKKPGKTAQGDRYVRVDGEPKHWDLDLTPYFSTRDNLNFVGSGVPTRARSA
jgi:hypothetical protein